MSKTHKCLYYLVEIVCILTSLIDCTKQENSIMQDPATSSINSQRIEKVINILIFDQYKNPEGSILKKSKVKHKQITVNVMQHHAQVCQ